MSLNIALGQIEVRPNRVDLNIKKILDNIKRAQDNQIDLLVFPEMALGGYLLADRWLNDNFCQELMDYNELIREASSQIAVAYGNIYLEKKSINKDGRRRRYNAVYIYQNQRPAKRLQDIKQLPHGVQPKLLLPNYRFFDDSRYFFSLWDVAQDCGVEINSLVSPFIIEKAQQNIPVGFELCEDLWCDNYRYQKKSLNLTKILLAKKSRYIVNLSASPWTKGKNQARSIRLASLKQDLKQNSAPFVYVNCVGAQNNGKNIITFDGNSAVYNSKGEAIILADRSHQEELIFVKDFETPALPKQKEDIKQKFSAICTGIRSLKDTVGIREIKFLQGLSGGIDSAVVLALLVHSLGSQNVEAINMPTKYNSQKTIDLATKIAKNLNVSLKIVAIDDLCDANKLKLEQYDSSDIDKKLLSLNNENLQAKIRSTSILSNYAQRHKLFLISNSNKLEIALGYATLYGDINGSIAPIGDLTKTEVFALAKYLNTKVFAKEVIPQELIPTDGYRFEKNQVFPSAELRENQIDPMKWGYHDALLEAMNSFVKYSIEDFVQWYIDGHLAEKLSIPKQMLSYWKLDDPSVFIEDLEWFDKSIHSSVFKRIQSPPNIITSTSAFGYDLRESMLPYRQSDRYKKLKALLV
jgi:NAD+ synthase (glutamine-hydrolysing)